MRKIITTTFVTLDGVMQAPGGPEEDRSNGFKFGGWTHPYFDDFMGQEMGKQMTGKYDLLLGRKTFEIFAGYSTGKLNWRLSPQVRYQALSSFEAKYPVKEHLFDFGVKLGIMLKN